MKCPYKLPIKKELSTTFENGFNIKNADDKIIMSNFFEAEADFLVQVINGWDKVDDELKTILLRCLCVKNSIDGIQFLGTSKESIGIIKEIYEIATQLLKEIGEQ